MSNSNSNSDCDYDSSFPPLTNLSSFDEHEIIRNRIVLFYFNLGRKENDKDYDALSTYLIELLLDLKVKMGVYRTSHIHNHNPKNMHSNPFYQYITMLYRLIAFTRDIYRGKGERKMTYMMIYSWYKVFPLLAIASIRGIVLNSEAFTFVTDSTALHDTTATATSSPAYGCWKDIKYFCFYVACRSALGHDDPLIETCMEIMNQQLLLDMANLSSGSGSGSGSGACSTVAKWIPRENTQFGWMFEKMAVQWAYMHRPANLSLYAISNQNVTIDQHERAFSKCCMLYRKTLSTLNRKIATVEVLQCAGKWSDILPENVPVCASVNKKRAFICNGSIGTQKRDRYICSQRFKKYYQDLNINLNNNLTGSNKATYSLYKYISQVLEPYSTPYSERLYKKHTHEMFLQRINRQWSQLIRGIDSSGSMDNFIPFVDLSWSMHDNGCRPLYNALAIGSIIAAKTALGPRLMSVGHRPSWIHFDNRNLTDMIPTILGDSVHQNTCADYFSAFELVIQSILETNMSFSKISKLVFVIISDMKMMDSASESASKTKSESGPVPVTESLSFHDKVVKLFVDSGINSSHKCALPIPHFIYWNVSNDLVHCTGSSATSTSTPLNVLHLSGDAISTFRIFKYMKKYNWTPSSYDSILHLVHHSRYNKMSEILDGFCCD